MVNDELIRAHLQDQVENLALHRSQYKDLSDEDWQFFLQQVEGYSRTKDKLPLFAHKLEDGCRDRHAYSLEDGASAYRLEDGCRDRHAYRLEVRGEGWWYPPRISCEQCSSEATARYKAELLKMQNAECTMHNAQLIDLTGGAGVDTYFMSEGFDSVDYVEQNEELCRLAEHNLPEKVSIHNCTAEDWLNGLNGEKAKRREGDVVLYIDPARRDKNGEKVFKLADCTPNVVELLPKMRKVADTIMIKLSPMLDITQALRELGDDWEVHVVAVKNEVKEVLLVHNAQCTMHNVTCVDLAEGWQFAFSREEETNAECTMHDAECTMHDAPYYLYEPCAAILKAGAYKLVGARYGLEKLGVNTHLYVSEKLITNFPGRCWKISGVQNAQCTMHNEKANVLTRNYPLSAEQLKKKLKVKDGGDLYIIGTRVGEKPVVLFAERV